MKTISDLLLIIYDILNIEEKKHPEIVNGVRTKYNPTENRIYIANSGIPKLFHELGHEAVHYLQNIEGRLTPYSLEDIKKYRGKKEGMFYKYSIEREATAFGWVLASCLNDYFYSNKEDIRSIYLYSRNYYSKMIQLPLQDVESNEVLNALQEKLNEAYNEAKTRYIKLIENKKSELLRWYNIG